MTAHADRLARLRALLGPRGLDALLVSQPESRYYLSGYTGHDLAPRDSAGYLLITQDKALLLTDSRTTEQAEREAPEYETVGYPSRTRMHETVGQFVNTLGLKRIGFESIHLPHSIWQAAHNELKSNNVELLDARAVVDELRLVKDAAELLELQEAVDVLDRCLAHICAWIQPGMSEKHVARQVELYLTEHANGVSFPSIVASGPNASMPHAVPSDRLIQERELIKIDIGAKAGWYCSDMTRTVSLGEPSDLKAREIYDIVLEAQLTAEAGIRPGMSARDADSLARDVIAKHGYKDRFTHSTGHGIGLEVHEPPWISQSLGDQTLQSGMVFSVEPGIYLPGWGGVRIEDLVVLEDAGPRVLCGSPKNLVIRG